MAKKVEIDVELLSDLVEAVGFVSTFNNMFHNGETSENCGDLNAVEYLASDAALIEQRGRTVLESAQQEDALDGLWDCTNCDNRKIGGGFAECPNCGIARQ